MPRPKPALPAPIPTALLLLLLAPAAGADEHRRVLPPSAGDVVLQAFRRAAPEWKLEGATLAYDHVEGRACLASGACAAFRLDEPSACAAPAGPWCLSFTGDEVPAAAREMLVRALAADDAAAVWKLALVETPTPSPDAAPMVPELRQPVPETLSASDLAAFGLAGLVVAIPLIFGLFFGHRVGARLRRGARLGVAAGLFAMPLLGAPTGLLSLGDLGFAGGLAAAGFLFSSAAADRLRPALAVTSVAVLVSLGLAELVARTAPPLPAPPRPHALALRPRAGLLRDLPCTRLDDQFALEKLRHHPESTPRVLHLGDSMVEGAELVGAPVFTSLLDTQGPRLAHLNAGVPGTGPDYHLVLARRLLPLAKPADVLLHLFAGNDLVDLDRTYSCCPEGPLLTDGPGPLEARCPTPRWRPTPESVLLSSPPPYPLAVAATGSRLARHACAAFVQAGRLVRDRWRPIAAEARRERLGRVLAALGDDVAKSGGTFAVVLLPDRAALEPPPPGEPDGRPARRRDHDALLVLAKGRGLAVVDALPILEQAVVSGGAASVFLDEPRGNVHLNAAGHQLVARWLLEVRGARWATLRSDGGPAVAAP